MLTTRKVDDLQQQQQQKQSICHSPAHLQFHWHRDAQLRVRVCVTFAHFAAATYQTIILTMAV